MIAAKDSRPAVAVALPTMSLEASWASRRSRSSVADDSSTSIISKQSRYSPACQSISLSHRDSGTPNQRQPSPWEIYIVGLSPAAASAVTPRSRRAWGSACIALQLTRVVESLEQKRHQVMGGDSKQLLTNISLLSSALLIVALARNLVPARSHWIVNHEGHS